MPRDPLHDAVYLKIETTIEENYRGADGSYPVAPHAVATLASLAALAAIEEEGYVIVRAEDIRGVLGPKRGVRAYIEAGRRPLDSAEHPAQPSGTLQDAPESESGISGRSDDPKGTKALSGLREELRRTVLSRNAANAMRGVHEHRATRLKTELDHAKAALAGENEAISLFMADCTKTAERLREQVNLWQKAAEQAEAKLDRLREPHTRGPRTNTCNDCGQDWPCETIQTIDEEKPNG